MSENNPTAIVQRVMMNTTGAESVIRDDVLGGVQVIIRFQNNWGASVIHNKYSYGVELAIIKWDASDDDTVDGYYLSDEQAIGPNVFGWLSEGELNVFLYRISNLTPNGNELTEGE